LAKEGRRCWTLEYAPQDGVGFHVDILPAVNESSGLIDEIVTLGVNYNLAEKSIAITDKNKERDTYNWSLSAQLSDIDIQNLIGDDTIIWELTLNTPHNDFLKSKQQLHDLRKAFRELLSRVVSAHGNEIKLHVFPACPNSAAIEFGRVWMPKADPTLIVYDRNTPNRTFTETLIIS
jgi:hypothetical protein